MKYKCDMCKTEIGFPYTFISQKGVDKHLCRNCTGLFSKWFNEHENVEYPLSFRGALNGLLKGKVVESASGEKYCLDSKDGPVMIWNVTDMRWQRVWTFPTGDRWKVVE